MAILNQIRTVAAMQVNILEAKNQLSQLVKRAQAGEEVIIANRGQPVARLVSAGEPALESNDIATWLARHPLPEYARRTAKAIDAAIAEERQAWD